MLAASRAGTNLIFAIGFLNYSALNAVAPRFPKLQYAGIDIGYGLLSKKAEEHHRRRLRRARGRLPRGVPRRSSGQEAGRRAGHQRRRCEQRARDRAFMSGYIQGAKKANPGITVLANYANDPTFSDQAKCKETALGQIQKGSQAVFQVAGGCGLGALSAAKDAGIWGIGVDADQLYLGPHMLTSALKRVNVAVADLTRAAYAGNLKVGGDYTYSLKNNGVGLGSVSPKVSKALIAKTKAIAVQIGEGKIVVKPTIKF